MILKKNFPLRFESQELRNAVFAEATRRKQPSVNAYINSVLKRSVKTKTLIAKNS